MPSRTSRKSLRRHIHDLAIKQFERQKLLNRLAKPGPFSSILILDNLKPNFNIGKIFRTADAMGVREIHLIGTDFFYPAPAKGSFKWVPARFFRDFASCHAALRQQEYTLYALEPFNSEDLMQCHLPAKSAFIFGHEEFGISFDKEDYPDIKTLRIPQWGKVQSLNVSVAAAMVMYEYVRQHGAKEEPAAPRTSIR